jgi:hypothetical protein
MTFTPAASQLPSPKKLASLARVQKLSRTFGIEIEAIGLSPQRAARVISDAGIPCTFEGYTHRLMTTWKVVTDASLSGSNNFEAVSPILTGQDGLEQIKTVMKALRDAGATVNRQCGMHVHFGVNAVTEVKTVVRFLKLYTRFENVLDGVQPPSRRANNAGYCQSIRLSADRYGDNAILSSHDLMLAGVRTTFDQLDAATTMREITNIYNTRNMKVNVQVIHRQPTIEIRHAAGTLNGTKATKWVELLDAMWRVAQTQPATGKPSMIHSDPKMGAKTFFRGTLNFERDLGTWMMKRTRELDANAREIARTRAAAERANAAAHAAVAREYD